MLSATPQRRGDHLGIDLLERRGRGVGIVRARPGPRRLSHRATPALVPEEVQNSRGERGIVADRHREGALGRQVADVADRRPDRRHAARGGLEQDERAGLVPGGVDEEVRAPVEGQERGRRQEPVEGHAPRQAEHGGFARDLAGEHVLADDVEARGGAGADDAAEGPERRRDVLDAVQAADEEKPGRRVPRKGLGERLPGEPRAGRGPRRCPVRAPPRASEHWLPSRAPRSGARGSP